MTIAYWDDGWFFLSYPNIHEIVITNNGYYIDLADTYFVAAFLLAFLLLSFLTAGRIRRLARTEPLPEHLPGPFVSSNACSMSQRSAKRAERPSLPHLCDIKPTIHVTKVSQTGGCV